MVDTIYKIIHGSTCYGLNTPESDIDYKGVFIPTKRQYYSLEKGPETIEKMDSKNGGHDSVLVSLEKFVKLAVNSNPNILEQLFVKGEFVVENTKYFQPFIENRDLFLS